MQITITLTEAQEAALFMMGKDEDAQQSIAQATFSARVRGDFKRYREAENKVNSAQYDWAASHGSKWPETKDAFLKRESVASRDILAQL